jgi:hypothetical protein
LETKDSSSADHYLSNNKVSGWPPQNDQQWTRHSEGARRSLTEPGKKITRDTSCPAFVRMTKNGGVRMIDLDGLLMKYPSGHLQELTDNRFLQFEQGFHWSVI